MSRKKRTEVLLLLKLMKKTNVKTGEWVCQHMKPSNCVHLGLCCFLFPPYVWTKTEWSDVTLDGGKSEEFWSRTT